MATAIESGNATCSSAAAGTGLVFDIHDLLDALQAGRKRPTIATPRRSWSLGRDALKLRTDPSQRGLNLFQDQFILIGIQPFALLIKALACRPGFSADDHPLHRALCTAIPPNQITPLHCAKLKAYASLCKVGLGQRLRGAGVLGALQTRVP